MTAQQQNVVDKWLRWAAAIGSVITTSIILSVSGAFIDMRDALIRMEKIPGTVETHEHRLDAHDSLIKDLQHK